MSHFPVVPELAADPRTTRACMEFLIARFEEYVSEHETPYMDAFMAAHNFHKAIVLDMADRGNFTGEARQTFLSMAVATWVEALQREAGK